ncbi:hypothetical protein SEA_LUCKYBARNES_28 [Brevibacterium phage LuckyBarnes]|uniref:Uncharacterized protein n=1 Tax=Brevibacterium phage LuckyBarnes TaxID=2027888 RepID=A0A249XNN3_9CAUD|nr:hypothetical protein HOS02_gp28 [Brevibacterium phage LuckyBarnes]ASZ73346.1 hypothetical protein SEA_LUCKYBARNES_28 [Brevibacterium phage LuckyBarnes]
MEPEPMIITRWLTCHTVGCGNAEVTLMGVFPEDVDALFCGVCSQPITDVATEPPKPITEMPTWEL